MIDLTVGLLVAVGAAAIAYLIVHDYYGVLNPTLAQDALAGAGVIAIAWASSFLSNRKRSRW